MLSKNKKRKILITHPQIIVGGGSEACALQIVDALKNEYDVSLATMGNIDLESLNNCYNTNINKNDINIISFLIPCIFKKKFDALRSYKLARFCKRNADRYDLIISSYNIMDFGKKGLQFIGDLSFDDNLRRKFDSEPKKNKKYFYHKSFLRSFYLKLRQLLFNESKDGWKKNITISNSNWCAEILYKVYKIKSSVIYPPVISKFSSIEWKDKESRFLYFGRISSEKQIEKIIEIIKIVRKDIVGLKLDIVGRKDDETYFNIIKNKCLENSDWCFLKDPVYGQEKLDFISKYKFGISARENEPFGISIAEMVKAGCIVFVPSGGGQTEIVENEDLIYHSFDDAIYKIKNVLLDKNLEQDIIKKLLLTKEKFSVERFTREVKNITENFFKEYE
jgi:glycosyltransferase involved in cell wall biosynthesis